MTDKFRKKPIVIEAFQYRPEADQSTWPAWAQPERQRVIRLRSDHLIVTTPKGDHYADPGDWIIRGIEGELYPCKPDVFSQSYEAVE